MFWSCLRLQHPSLLLHPSPRRFLSYRATTIVTIPRAQTLRTCDGGGIFVRGRRGPVVTRSEEPVLIFLDRIASPRLFGRTAVRVI